METANLQEGLLDGGGDGVRRNEIPPILPLSRVGRGYYPL